MERPYRINAQKLKEAAAGYWPAIFADLAPQLRTAVEKSQQKRNPPHVPRPDHAGGKDGFRFLKDWQETGAAVLNQTLDQHDAKLAKQGSHGYVLTGGLDTLMWVNHWSFPEALQQVNKWLGGSEEETVEVSEAQKRRNEEIARQKAEEKRKQDEYTQKRLNELWGQKSIALTDPGGSVGIAYFQNRGIHLQQWPDVCRVVHDLTYYCGEREEFTGTYPAIVSLFCQHDGQPATLHRIFLEQDGSDKAPEQTSKKLASYPSWKDIRGGAIPLFGPRPGDGDLHVGEGIETMLAVRMALQELAVTWAAGTAGSLASFTPPSWVKRLIIWADLDLSQTGEREADTLARRMAEIGLPVYVIIPGDQPPPGQKSYDWLDVLRDYGPQAIAYAHQQFVPEPR
ncbi:MULTISPECIES: toprim domain-containing protein [unclassified Thioalkalivibrio]|uniref:DUF7146 domain-containing protein n=1 Tax=unclassified Thioalkalivibrio TaxID=2621013 RepID=UPI00037144E4|nr:MULTISPECIES: toprim domain-containing protein [unclassified Thioalkalivibrio]